MKSTERYREQKKKRKVYFGESNYKFNFNLNI